MKPALKAYKFYRKNRDYYADLICSFYDDEEKLMEVYESIAQKFSASGQDLREIANLSYERFVDAAFNNHCSFRSHYCFGLRSVD